MISVLDYGVGNLGSIMNMMMRAGVEASLISSPEEVNSATKLLLPGVGSFDNGMQRLSESGMREPLRQRVLADGIPILGICLGMQMLGAGSEEGREPGLGFIDAECRRFRFPDEPSRKVPHMGWSIVKPRQSSRLLANLGEEARFYFVHSYHVVAGDPALVLATSTYGIEFVAMVQRGNVMGAQFHPEKSHRFGMTLLANFAEL
jgi:imidazole glycerol-phosphate synthase subunit HisH